MDERRQRQFFRCQSYNPSLIPLGSSQKPQQDNILSHTIVHVNGETKNKIIKRGTFPVEKEIKAVCFSLVTGGSSAYNLLFQTEKFADEQGIELAVLIQDDNDLKNALDAWIQAGKSQPVRLNAFLTTKPKAPLLATSSKSSSTSTKSSRRTSKSPATAASNAAMDTREDDASSATTSSSKPAVGGTLTAKLDIRTWYSQVPSAPTKVRVGEGREVGMLVC